MASPDDSSESNADDPAAGSETDDGEVDSNGDDGKGDRPVDEAEPRSRLGRSAEGLGVTPEQLGVTQEQLGLPPYEPDTGPRGEDLAADEPLREIGVRAEVLDRTQTPSERLRLPRRAVLQIALLVLGYLVVLSVFVAEGGPFELPLIPTVVLAAFVLETTDSAAGMGFGTGLAPLLFVFGYTPLQIVPVLLFSQAITGIVAGFVHDDFDNVSFTVRPLNEEAKLLALLVGTGSVAVFGSVVLTHYAIGVSDEVIQTYVSLLVVVMGLIGLVRAKLRTRIEYRPARLVGFALLAGVSKGIGAGGYGPVVTLGQILSGVYEKSAVAITTLAEGIVSVVGTIAFFFLFYYGVDVDLTLLPSIFAGGFLAAIVGPYLVRVVPNTVWRYVIPLYAFGVGLVGLAFGLEI